MLIQNPNLSQSADWAAEDSLHVALLGKFPASRLSGVVSGLFFVSVPVFLQAPLVRFLPWLSLLGTIPWIIYGLLLLRRPERFLLGDLILGFSWSWLAGSLYWGWLRSEPLWHLPIEAIGLPFALWALWRGSLLVGHCFYLGSLLGTAITDFYFYALNLIPDWRRVMEVDVQGSIPILHHAAEKIQTFSGFVWAFFFVSILVTAGLMSLRSNHFHWWVFSGAVLGTLLVDALFGLSAFL